MLPLRGYKLCYFLTLRTYFRSDSLIILFFTRTLINFFRRTPGEFFIASGATSLFKPMLAPLRVVLISLNCALLFYISLTSL